MSGEDSKSNFVTKLTSANYPTWKGEMKTYLRVKGLWLLVNGSETRHLTDADSQSKWDIKADKAAGELYLACSVEQRMHIDAVQDDPVKIWTTLASIHLQQRPGARFNAWDDFFSIRKQPDESLSTLIARIEDGMSKIKELRPNDPKNPYTIKDLDAELICMTMVRSLGEEYSHFASSLMLLKSLDKSELQAAFLAEESQRRRRPEGPGGDTAMFSTSGTCKCGPTATCYFCEQPGHCTHKCHAKQAKNNAKANAGRSGQGRRPRNANKASETPATSSTLPSTPTSSTTAPGIATTSQNAQHTSQSAQRVTEFAGNASLCSFDPSHPLCPLQLDADADWNADTGATSHMTPHRHWLRNYDPKRVAIKLADNNIVYSAGVGTVVFSPAVDGKTVRAVELTRVLHVPDLRNNLLSVLYLTRNIGFTVHINSSNMSFERPTGTPLFVASISSSNAAFLDGSTVPLAEYASAATTVPLDIDLWHRRLAHHHLAGVRTLLDKKLVTGMKLDSTAAPDPICEPCLAGKMHSNPFPSSQWRASRPLELVHTDLHQVPYPSFSGF